MMFCTKIKPKQIFDAFADVFSSAYDSYVPNGSYNKMSFTHSNLDSVYVYNYLFELDSNKDPGPDLISNHLLKNCAFCIIFSSY